MATKSVFYFCESERNGKIDMLPMKLNNSRPASRQEGGHDIL